MRVFSVEFMPPRAGWLELVMRSDDDELRLLVSHTPFDSLQELASAAVHFLEAGTPGLARFHFEPEQLHLSFEPGPRPGALRLRAIEFTRRASSPRLVWAHEGDAVQIARTLWRAFRRLESQFPAEHWVHPFPSRFVAGLASVR